MRFLLLALGLVLPAAAAYGAIGKALRAPFDLASHALRVGLALPLGLGAASLLTYVWLLGGGTLGRTYAVADFVVFGAAVAALRPWASRFETLPGVFPARLDERLAPVVAVLALVVAAVSFVQTTVVNPIGGWDAWAIWNSHARFLFRGGDGWRAMFDPQLAYSHTEYPLLLPAAIARLWAYSGESVVEPALVAGVFTLSTVLVVFGAVSRRAGPVAGATASLLLLATESWRFFGPSQYGDVPVACYVAGAVACVTATRRDEEPSRRMLVLAGVFLGLAAWTKDEGLVLGALFGGWAILGTGPGPIGPIGRRAAALAAGAAVPLAARVHFQLALSPTFAGVFTSGQTFAGSLRRVLAGERWAVIAREVPEHLPGAQTWLPLVAVGAVAVLGARWRELPRSAVIPALLAWCAYVVVYAITPLDLRWHVASSAARVLLQPWPALLVGLFGMAAAPEPSRSVASPIA